MQWVSKKAAMEANESMTLTLTHTTPVGEIIRTSDTTIKVKEINNTTKDRNFNNNFKDHPKGNKISKGPKIEFWFLN